MPPRSRHVRLFCNHVEDLLSPGSDRTVIRAAGNIRRWKCERFEIIESRLSSCLLGSTSQPEESPASLACTSEFDCHRTDEDYLLKSLNIFSIESIRTRASTCGVGNISPIYFANKKESFKNGWRQCNIKSLLSSELQKHAMRGWSGSRIQIQGAQECKQNRGSGRRTHMDHAHHEEGSGPGGAGEKVLKLGLLTDVLLTIGKGAAGYVSGSAAIIADAAHSLSDIVLSGVALWTSKASKAPKDKEHPYGHGKIETMGALTISSLLLATGGGIAWHAAETLQVLLPALSTIHMDTVVQTTLDTIHQQAQSHSHDHEDGAVGHHHGIDMEHMEVALFAAIVSIGAKEGLYWMTRAEGEKSGSALLKANAWHHRSDAISSVVALIGVGGAMLGMPLLDPVAALFVAGMIVKAGLETGYQSMQELLDKGLPDKVLTPIRKTVLQVQGVEGIHQLRGRRMGSTVHLDVHIEVDPWLSVSAAHNIGEAVRQQVHKHHPNVTESFVHIDPADGRPAVFAPGELEMDFEGADEHDHRSNDHSHSHDHSHDHEKSTGVGGEVKNEHLHLQRDLTSVGSKADLLESSTKAPRDGHGVFRDNVNTLQQSEVERVVRFVLDANFHKTAKVKHVTCHFLQGKVVVEVGVSLDEDLSIRDAIQRAKDMESCLFSNVPDISAVSVQLKLS